MSEARRAAVGVSEDEFIGQLSVLVRQAAARTGAPVLGIGDDAALLRPNPGMELALSVDDAVEDVHFRRRWCPPLAIGRRAAGAALSDLAAMGALPRAALLALHCPGGWAEGELLEVVRGFIAKLAEAPCPLIGGNLTRTMGGLALSVTVIGEVEVGRALLRSSARPGDGLYISRRPGGSALALHLLEADAAAPEDQGFLAPYLDPCPQLALGRALLGLAAGRRAPAVMDLSDGLLSDARRLGHASGVAFEIDTLALLDPAIERRARSLGLDPLGLALSSGEEYSLLIAAAPELASILAALGVWRIGIARAGLPGELRDAQGAHLVGRGHDHFAAARSDSRS